MSFSVLVTREVKEITDGSFFFFLPEKWYVVVSKISIPFAISRKILKDMNHLTPQTSTESNILFRIQFHSLISKHFLSYKGVLLCVS